VSNTATRVLVACVAIPCILALAWVGGYAWFAFAAALGLAATREYRAMARAKGAEPQLATVAAWTLGFALVFLHDRLAADVARLSGGAVALPSRGDALLCIAFALVVAAPAAELFRRRGSAILNLGATFFGALYLGLCLGAVLGIREMFTPGNFPVARVFGTALPDAAQLATLDRTGAFTTMGLLATIWICDTAAYFGGRATGRHALFPRVSPRKTWEGAAWGFAAALAAMLALRALVLDYLSLADALVLGGLVGTVGQLGDLVESLLKRDAAVKDSSALIPGHGGVFDRFDSLLYVAPFVFGYLKVGVG
jgi:phosphatidate cytidylyltransferase